IPALEATRRTDMPKKAARPARIQPFGRASARKATGSLMLVGLFTKSWKLLTPSARVEKESVAATTAALIRNTALGIFLAGLLVSPAVCDMTTIPRYPDMAIVIAYRKMVYVGEVPKRRVLSPGLDENKKPVA